MPDKYRLVRRKSGDSYFLQLEKRNGDKFELEKGLALKSPPTTNDDWVLNSPPSEAKNELLKNNPTFQLLQLYDPAPDVLRGSSDASAGILRGWAKYKGGNAFDILVNGNNADNRELKAAYAYLCSFQFTYTANGPIDAAHEEYCLNSFQRILSQMFPLDDNGNLKNVESTVRALPEFLGPIPIVDEEE